MHALSKKWHLFHDGPPGRRFQEQYRRNHRKKDRGQLHKRVLRWIGAGVALAVAIVLSVIPGPAIPFYFIAGSLVAADWLWMAKTLDWIEVKARAFAARFKKFWHRRSKPARVALLILGACFSAASTYTFYQLIH